MSSPHLVKESSPLGLSLSGPVSELSTGCVLNFTRLSTSRPQTSLVVFDKSQALNINQTYDDYTPNQMNDVGVGVNEHSSLKPHQITITSFFHKSGNAAFLTARGEPWMGRVAVHRVDERYHIRTGFTPKQGWQGWVLLDGQELCKFKRLNSRAAAMVRCQGWIKSHQKQSSAA